MLYFVRLSRARRCVFLYCLLHRLPTWLWLSHLDQCLPNHLDYDSKFRHIQPFSLYSNWIYWFCEVYECQEVDGGRYYLGSSFIALTGLCCGMTRTEKSFFFLGHISTFHIWILLEKKRVLNELLTEKAALTLYYFSCLQVKKEIMVT